MKLLLAAIVVLSTATGMAQEEEIELQSGDQLLSLIGEGEVVSVGLVAPKCPKGASCSPALVANVLLKLGGCADHLGPVTANVERTSNSSYSIVMSAVLIHNELSRRAKCVRQPTATVQVKMPAMGFSRPDKKDVELIMLTGANVDVVTK